MRLNLTCKETARLVLEGEDRALPLTDKALIRMHLSICRNCAHFARQVQLMRGAMDHWRRHAEDDPASPRIQTDDPRS